MYSIRVYQNSHFKIYIVYRYDVLVHCTLYVYIYVYLFVLYIWHLCVLTHQLFFHHLISFYFLMSEKADM